MDIVQNLLILFQITCSKFLLDLEPGALLTDWVIKPKFSGEIYMPCE